jgi:hypothetical protein
MRLHKAFYRQQLTHQRLSSQERAARTRTLIQLGGLMVKSGLVDKMSLRLGEDLQKNPEQSQHAFKLLDQLQRWTQTLP